MFRSFLAAFFSFNCFLVQAQFTYTIDQSIPVEVNGRKLSLPWAGGLNSTQINTMDLNGDNLPDLVIFDKAINKVLPFLRQNNQYVFAPDYQSSFPKEVTQWMLLRDFNCDGKKDIFTSDPFGVKVFVNITPAGSPLKWRLFNPGFPLLTKGFSVINLKINDTDIPAIDDIDGDGDLDILNVRFVGIGQIEWHKNLSIENTGKCDSLILERVTQYWGGVTECSCGSFRYAPAADCSTGGRTEHAGGKSMITLDMDNDGDRELIFSEESCSRLYYFENNGTKSEALVTGFSLFPAANPAVIPLYPAAYLEDVDADGTSELIVSSNLPARDFLNNNFQKSVWLYKNTGSKQLPSFSLIKQNFLQDDMIEVGDYAVPAFFDTDDDGDQDMFISTYANIGFRSSVYYFENIGTASSPSFKLITDDYLSLSAIGQYNLKLQFADVNADGKIDFVFTSTNVRNGITELSYIANSLINGLGFTDAQVINTGFTIGQNENVLLTDVNQDGLNDILLGKATGAVQYWKNNSPASNYNFSMTNGSFLGLGSSLSRQNPSLSTSDLDADGRSELLVCDQSGNIFVYTDFREQNPAIPGVNAQIKNSLSQQYESRNLGGRIMTVPVNLFDTDKPAIIVGTTLGGLLVLKNDGGADLPDQPVVSIYPNPAGRKETIFIRSDRNVLVQFYTVLGQKISETYFVPANQAYPIDASSLASGLYIARFSSRGKMVSHKFIVQ